MPHAIAPRIEPGPTSTEGLVGDASQGPLEQAVRVTSQREFQQVFGGPQPGQDLFLATSQFFANGGRQAWVVRLGARSTQALRRALAALDAADDLGLLCLPGLSGGRSLAEGAAYARGRRAFFLGDPAASRRATLEAVRAIPAADAGHAAVYFPRLRVPDPLQPSATRLCGASASEAGLLARTDRERGVWAVAAGTTAWVAGAVGLASAIDDRSPRSGLFLSVRQQSSRIAAFAEGSVRRHCRASPVLRARRSPPSGPSASTTECPRVTG